MVSKVSPDTTAEPSWMTELLSDAREAIQPLLDEAPLALSALRADVSAYAVVIAEAGPRADQHLGGLLAERLHSLLDRLGTPSAEHHRLAQIAVRYFVMDDDGDDDLASPFGLDDDVEVFNAIAATLGLEDLVITEA